MKNEITVLILQDRSIGLETLQDDLRRVQLFPLFSYVANEKELQQYLKQRRPDVLLFVQHHFEMSFEEVQHAVHHWSHDIPIIAIVPRVEELFGMGLLK